MQAGHDGELLDGVVQLRFSDDDGHVQDINAAELAEVLQGLVEFTSDISKTGALGNGMPPQVRVRPPREGSFIIEAIVLYAQTNPIETISGAMTAGGVIVKSFDVGLKKLRGVKVADYNYVTEDLVKVNWSNGDVDEIPAPAWKVLNSMKAKTRKSLRKIMTPLSDNVDKLEVREGGMTETTEQVLDTAPAAVATRSDYRVAVAEPDDISESSEFIEAEAQLGSIDFRVGEKWRVQTTRGTRLARVEDEAFLADLDRGAALRKSDIFDVKIRVDKVTKNESTTTEWSLVEVKLKRRGDVDGDGESSAEGSA